MLSATASILFPLLVISAFVRGSAQSTKWNQGTLTRSSSSSQAHNEYSSENRTKDEQWNSYNQMEAVAVREDPVTAEYEIVVARYRENSTVLAWLYQIPTFYQITIYNTVSHFLPLHITNPPSLKVQSSYTNA